jgi:hypothetical protein
VTQPDPEFLNHGGTLFSTEAVHKTCVSPNLTKQDPSACFDTPVSKEILRISLFFLSEGRIFYLCLS